MEALHVAKGERARLGFGSHFALAAAEEHTERRLRAVNEQLLGWPVPALWLVMLPFLLGRARGKEAWLLGPLAALLIGYAFYWYFEAEIPGRYLFEALPMLLILSKELRVLPTGTKRCQPHVRTSIGKSKSGFLSIL